VGNITKLHDLTFGAPLTTSDGQRVGLMQALLLRRGDRPKPCALPLFEEGEEGSCLAWW
jgi:hypothetical protein